jgi:hypothetical protein
MLMRKRREQSMAMIPRWIVVLSAIELFGVLAVALGIATAAPEGALIGMRNESNLEMPL